MFQSPMPNRGKGRQSCSVRITTKKKAIGLKNKNLAPGHRFSDKEEQPKAEYNSPYKKEKKIALKMTVPINVAEEERKFFASNCTVNPQFEYSNNILAEKFLKQFKKPSTEYLKNSIRIMKAFLKKFGSEAEYLMEEGPILTQEETKQYVQDYLKRLGVQEHITINFSHTQVVPTSVTHDSKTKKTKLNIRLPIEYRRDRIIGLLHHEIGTHFIRKFNDRKQKWHGKKQYDIKNCIVTEEGLACVNQMIEKAQMKNKSKFFYKAALNYYTAYQASTMSFVELYNDLIAYQEDPVKRWRMCL